MIINNVAGFGDVLFCEPIYRKIWQDTGKKPEVIIHDHQLHLQKYIESAVFIPASRNIALKDSTHHNSEFINLRFANQIFRAYEFHDHHDYENVMLDKYRLLELPEDLWKTLKLNFDYDAGERLAKVLGVGLFDEYVLRNVHSQIGDITINLNTKKQIVDMRSVNNFTLIDWFLIHAQADEIHTVSTSTFYLMQALHNRSTAGWNSPEVYVYPRPNEDGLRGISQLKPDFNLILK